MSIPVDRCSAIPCRAWVFRGTTDRGAPLLWCCELDGADRHHEHQASHGSASHAGEAYAHPPVRWTRDPNEVYAPVCQPDQLGGAL